MSRRSQAGVQDFGSDSFLDIIANIVGILIILIVIAGMKVAHQSTQVVEESTATADATSIDATSIDVLRPADVSSHTPPPEAASAAAMETGSGELAESEQLAKEAFAPSAAATEPLDQAPESGGPDLETLAAELAAELATLTADRQTLEAELTSLEQQKGDLEAEVAVAAARQEQVSRDLDAQRLTSDFAAKRRELLLAEQQKLTTEIATLDERLAAQTADRERIDSTLNGLTKRQKYVLEALDQIAEQTRGLREVLLETPAAAEPADRLNHRIRPVSRAVETTEQHFRLEGGRIAHIPLEGLLERVRRQMAQKVSVVRRFRRAEGVAGPVGGFRMSYVMERQSADPIQALKYGQSGYRISVSRWTIVPAETLQAETVEQALRMGSRFRQIIEATPPDTVLTIWLYPSEFQHFGRLRELAHRLNLRVAARPLPDGTPISGSPNGSRSASQ